jgi:hypothetical protein
MRTSYRALSVELVEDRSLPSTFLFIEPGYGYASHGREASYASHQDAGYAPRGNFGFEEVIFRNSNGGSTTFIFINNGGYGGEVNSGGFQLIPIFGGTGSGQGANPIPTPTGTGTVGDGGSSSNGGQSDGGSDFGPTPVATTHSAAQAQANTPASFGPTDVAGFVGNANTTTTTPVATQQAATAAQVAAVVNGQPAVTLATTPTVTHAGYAITATTPDAAPGDAMPPAPSVPLDPAPVPTPDTTAVASGIVTVAATVAAPIAGALPFDVAGLSSGASQFLDHVTDLAPTWPESMPAFTDSLWVAAAALLTGGAVHAAAARSAPKSSDVFGRSSALSEWARRTGRVTG